MNAASKSLRILAPMRIEDSSLKHWMEHFYGYGSWTSPLWFVAHEEGGGEIPEEVAERMNYFQNTHGSASSPVLCDLRDLYRHLAFRYEGPKAQIYTDHYQYRFGPDPVLHGYWRNLISFVHGFKQLEAPDLVSYQRHSFASTRNGSEAWLKLFPLPAPHTHGWYYNWLDLPGIDFLKTRKLYEDHLFEQRINTILKQAASYKPEVIVMYGMTNISRLKQSLSNFFEGIKYWKINAVKMRIPQHHTFDTGTTRIVITTQIPGLRHNRIETGFDWAEFGRRVNTSLLNN